MITEDQLKRWKTKERYSIFYGLISRYMEKISTYKGDIVENFPLITPVGQNPIKAVI
jgi:hypothetical protein